VPVGRWPGVDALIVTPCFFRQAAYSWSAARCAAVSCGRAPAGAEARQATKAALIFFWSVIFPSTTPCFFRDVVNAEFDGGFAPVSLLCAALTAAESVCSVFVRLVSELWSLDRFERSLSTALCALETAAWSEAIAEHALEVGSVAHVLWPFVSCDWAVESVV
jgi:hypothetical protein